MDLESFRACMAHLARFLNGRLAFESLLIRIAGDTKLGRNTFSNPGKHFLLQSLSGVFNHAYEFIDFGTLAESGTGVFKPIELRIEQYLFKRGNALSMLLFHNC